jgi:hypothetical protein
MKTSIIIPPNPGLMGAFGVALEVAKRFEAGMAAPSRFDLDALIERHAIREGGFTCAGGKEKCDRKCEISRISVAGKSYPFGGACNKYYNMRLRKEVDAGLFDLVAIRQNLLFHKYGVIDALVESNQDKPAKTVGIMRSFMTHLLFPF